MLRCWTVAAALAALVASPAAGAAGGGRQPLAVAAAANLKTALEELEVAFEARRPGVSVAVTLGASGAFFAQIQNGAPFDVFFSADRDYPRKVVEAGLGGDETVYAVGRLVVWVPRGAAVDLERRGVKALADAQVHKVAIANPAVAPYGRAAEAALRAAGVHDAVRGKLVLGQNVSQAAQFARSGAAHAALIPLSLALAPELRDAGRHVLVPEDSYPRLEQSAVVLERARDPQLARALLAFVTGEEGRAILTRHGYALP